jgi:hypothetical protein
VGPTPQTALDFYDASVDGNLDKAMSFVVDDIVCEGLLH